MKMIFRISDPLSDSWSCQRRFSYGWTEQGGISNFFNTNVRNVFPAGWPCGFSSSWSMDEEKSHIELNQTVVQLSGYLGNTGETDS